MDCSQHTVLTDSINKLADDFVEIKKSNVEISTQLKEIAETQKEMSTVKLKNGSTKEISRDEFNTFVYERIKSIEQNTALITDGAKMYNAISNFVKKHKTAVMLLSIVILLLVFDKSYVWNLITNYIKNLF